MTTAAATRTLSLHERYAVARRSINSASVVTVAALLYLDTTTFTTTQSDESGAFEALQAHLAARIESTLRQYPLLGYCIDGARSSKPRWSPVEPKPTAKQILHTGSLNSAQQSGNDDVEWFLSNAVLSEQLALPTTTDQEKGPLWKVQLNLVANDRCLVVLSTDHVINDGMGTLNLFRLLLGADDSLPPALTTSTTSAAIPPASDKIFSFKPSLGYMLGVVFDELILPILPIPKKLRAKLRGPVSWPMSSPSTSKKRKAEETIDENDVVRQPKACTPSLTIILLSAPNLIKNLKKLALAHIDAASPSSGKKAATLHSIIHTLALVSLYAAIAKSHQTAATALDDFKLVLGTATPISLREDTPLRSTRAKRLKQSPTSLPLSPAVESSSKLLPFTSGNFVSSLASNYTLSGRSTTFWAFTHSFAAELGSPKGRKLAKQHMGLLGYIPDFDASSKLDSEGCKYANGWEKFFGEKGDSATPYDAAFTISNLGFLDTAQLAIDCAKPSSETMDSNLTAIGVEEKEGMEEDEKLVEGQLSPPIAMEKVREGKWRVSELTWSQSHTPQGEAFGVDIVGFSSTNADGVKMQNLSIALSTRPDAFKDKLLHKRLERYLRRIVLAFATDTNAVEKPALEAQRLDLNSDPSFATLARFLIRSDDE